MPEPTQLELTALTSEACDLDFLRLIREVVEALGGPDFVAGKLDVQPSLLRNALSRKNYNHVWAEHLPWLVIKDPGTRLLEYLCGLRGYELKQAEPISSDEHLEGMRVVLARKFPYDADKLEAEGRAEATRMRREKERAR